MNSRSHCKSTVRIIFILLMSVVILVMLPEKVEAKKDTVTYTIGSKTKPCDNSKKYKNYNQKTKQYYMVLSYMKQLESDGGGTLVFKKGTYTITNTIYVPSNVEIIFKDGVVIKKGNDTGTTAMTASKSIFTLCDPSKSNTKGAYCKYNGVENVSFIGEGNVVIDLNYVKDVIGIIMGHNQNVTIQGITFQNMQSGHFIEMDASKNITIDKCTFKNHKDSTNNNKEAINLDTPDKKTEGFHAIWSSYDKTPNYNITIKNSTFKDLERAIGTHKYSGDKYHTKIEILNNEITNCDIDAIRVMNWKDITIQKNGFTNVANQKAGYRAILISGSSEMNISDNHFKDTSRSIQLMPWKNSGPGEEYEITYNKVTDEECTLMLQNTLENVQEKFIRINNTYGEFVNNTVKIYFAVE